MDLLRIAQATIIDPVHGVDGREGDLWIDVQAGRIIAEPEDPSAVPHRTIDAKGYVVMPGGIDLHCHIAGPKVNTGRALTPEASRSNRALARTDRTRSGTVGVVPTTFATGYLFTGMGYTTAMDAAIPPLHARQAHDELRDTPILDKGFYTLLGNSHYVLDRIAAGDDEGLEAYVAWALGAAKAYAVKVVNPGGVEDWKQISRKSIRELDEPTGHFGVSSRQIVRKLAEAVDRLGLPHPVHLHCNNLGVPGNAETTLRTMQALDGHRGHFAHIQFHSYDGDPNDPRSFASAVPKLLEYVKAHPNVSIDVGHVNAGPAMILTGDTPVSYNLHRASRSKWFAADLEQESSCGVIPIEYRPESRLIHAVQWAISLEWYLLMDDPWRIALTSDHPNGGAFFRYPEILALLMDRAFRREALQRMPKALRSRTMLDEIDREYTLSEIAIITRAAPARLLGLSRKGHLGPGADADLTIYQPQSDRRAMFERPRWVLKRGVVVAEDGEVQREQDGTTLYLEPPHDQDQVPHIRRWFEQDYSIRFANYPVDLSQHSHTEQVPCASL